MFTINFNNYLSKSQEANVLAEVKKDFWINFITNILLISIFTTLFFNTRNNVFNLFFVVATLFCCYNSFTSLNNIDVVEHALPSSQVILANSL